MSTIRTNIQTVYIFAASNDLLFYEEDGFNIIILKVTGKKIAVPVKDINQIDAHFGHCAFYQIYEISSNQVVSVTKMDSPQGCGYNSNACNYH